MLNLFKIRQYLHRNPELSGEEVATQKFILKQLNDLGLKPKKVGKTGVMVSLGNGNIKIMVRVDIDALPIYEINTFDYKSNIDGISHMCGHDGHTTIGIGLAEKFLKSPIENIQLHILFQPAEENGNGAQWVVDDNAFKKLKIDYVLALHNVPGYPKNQIVVKPNSFTPAVQSLKIILKGKTAHAAEPQKGYNPHVAIAKLIIKASETENQDSNSNSFLLFTPIYTNIGEKNYGIAPDYGEVHFTIRSWKQDLLDSATSNFIEVAKELATKYKLEITSKIFEKFHANQNDSHVVSSIKKAAKQLNLDTLNKNQPFSWGEDFGLFTQLYPGAMFGLGAGENIPALHNPNYDFPDEITTTGINMFYETIIMLQNAK